MDRDRIQQSKLPQFILFRRVRIDGKRSTGLHRDHDGRHAVGNRRERGELYGEYRCTEWVQQRRELERHRLTSGRHRDVQPNFGNGIGRFDADGANVVDDSDGKLDADDHGNERDADAQHDGDAEREPSARLHFDDDSRHAVGGPRERGELHREHRRAEWVRQRRELERHGLTNRSHRDVQPNFDNGIAPFYLDGANAVDDTGGKPDADDHGNERDTDAQHDRDAHRHRCTELHADDNGGNAIGDSRRHRELYRKRHCAEWV